MAAGVENGRVRRTRARRGHGEQLRGQILEAAAQLLSTTQDVDGVSIRAVADAVGVTPPSIYLHFADKTELMWAVCEERAGLLDERMRRAVEGATDPLDALHRQGQAYVRFGLENPETYRVLFMGHGFPGAQAQSGQTPSAALSGVIEMVDRAMDQGQLRRDDVVQTALGLWALVHGVTSLLLSLPHYPWPDAEEFLAGVLDQHLKGIAERSGSESSNSEFSNSEPLAQER